MRRHATLEERRRVVGESLRVCNPANKANDLPAQADPRHDCQVELNVDDIHPYEHNPRCAINAKFVEIKESIRSAGIRNPLTVTRRPGEAHFIVEAGGNTRLLAIQELWTETRNARFQKITVLFRPWRSETHVLTAHLIENEQRGEMTFWDKANGVVTLKAKLELEKGHALSLKQLEAELEAIGLSTNPATLSHYLFATNRLRTLCERVASLSGLDVRLMQPRLNLIRRYAQLRASIAEDELYAKILEPVFLRDGDRYQQTAVFSAPAVCQACEEALAEHLLEPVTLLRTRISKLARSLQVSLEELLADGNAATATGPDDRAPADCRRAPDVTPDVSTANALPKPREGHANASAASVTDEHPLTRLVEQVRQLADLAGIGECLEIDGAAPHGYFMRDLPRENVTDIRQRLKRNAWALLTLVSGQRHGGPCEPSPYNALERGVLPTFPSSVASESLPAVLADPGFFGWLLGARDEGPGVAWQILSLVREQRACIPQPRPSGDEDADMAGIA